MLLSKSILSSEFKRLAITAGCILSVLAAPGCSNKDDFKQSQTTEVFSQDYNPHMLEVLWVVDDRSPMRKHRDEIVDEAGYLFANIDSQLGTYGQYRMAFVNHDARVGHKGVISPATPITRGTGTLAERTAYFKNEFPSMLNLSTDAISRGFATSLEAMTNTFKTDSRIPTVLVYLSYGDDKSTTPSGEPVISYYAQKLLALKNNKPELLRIYSVNYAAGGQRCALQNGADIDSPGFEDRFNQLAVTLSGETADLCSTGWGQSFDLTGVQLKTLPKRFALQGNPKVDTISVSMQVEGMEVVPPAWAYDSSTREIVFATVPDEGAVIVVTYFPIGL
ncbi:hypothetical protein K2X33_13020 [bacterium]|nr:hypothetical protein [bacterium]